MEIARQAEVRLATWLCEAIEDTIGRYQYILKELSRSLIEHEAQAAKEKGKQSDPVLAKYANPEMYEGFAAGDRAHIKGDKQALDRLLTLVKAALELRRQVTEFWEGQEKRWEEPTDGAIGETKIAASK